MSIFYWIVFGLISGSIAEFLAPSSQGGILGSIILGIVGAVVGGYLGQRFMGVGVSGFNLPSIVVAVIGPLIGRLIGRLF